MKVVGGADDEKKPTVETENHNVKEPETKDTSKMPKKKSKKIKLSFDEPDEG